MPFKDVIGHERPKSILQSAISRDRVAHAYLFFGEPAIGKRRAAIRFTQAINCDAEYGPEGPDACGTCRSCRQIEGRTHPDFLVIEPDKDRATPQIKIEQIRELEQYIIYRPLIGHRKVCLIDEADRLTLAAANALLKTLEEPPAHSLFLLISDRPSALPATVRSRCQGLRFSPPPRALVEAALVANRGLTPETARFLTLATDSRIGETLTAEAETIRARQRELETLTTEQTLAVIPELLSKAEALARGERAAEALDWIGRWIRDLVAIKVGADRHALVNPEAWQPLGQAASGARVEALLDLLDSIDRYQRGSTRNLNLHLALESVLLGLRDALGYDQPAAPPVR